MPDPNDPFTDYRILPDIPLIPQITTRAVVLGSNVECDPCPFIEDCRMHNRSADDPSDRIHCCREAYFIGFKRGYAKALRGGSLTDDQAEIIELRTEHRARMEDYGHD
jgi:hypothetical protein